MISVTQKGKEKKVKKSRKKKKTDKAHVHSKSTILILGYLSGDVARKVTPPIYVR